MLFFLKNIFYRCVNKINSIYYQVKNVFTVRDIHGLVLGCGHETEDRHNLCAHPYKNFITLDLCDYKKPDLLLPAHELLNNREFMKKYRGKLRYVVFENIDPEGISPDPITGKINSLEAAYEILANDGICIIAVGGWSADYINFYAKLSSFSHGQYLQFGKGNSKHVVDFSPFYPSPMLIVKKTPGNIIVDDNLKKILKGISKRNSDAIYSEDMREISVDKIDSLQVYSLKKEQYQDTSSLVIPKALRDSSKDYDSLMTTAYNETIRVVNGVPPAVKCRIEEGSKIYIPDIKRPSITPSALVIKLKFAIKS